MSDDFKKPLDQWVDEEREVERPTVDFDPETRTPTGIRTEKVTIKVPTRYTRAETYASICSFGNHAYQVTDRHRYIATCRKCPKRVIYRPDRETIKDGHVVARGSGVVLD